MVVDKMAASECIYELLSGKKCGAKVYKTSPYCILHIELPDKTNPQYTKIRRAKSYKVRKKIDPKKRDFNFEGAKIESIDLSGRQDISSLNFVNATIKGHATFENAMIEGYALFKNAMIEGYASFDGATLEMGAYFDLATIEGEVSFENATIKGFVSFGGATVEMSARFDHATIEGDISFQKALVTNEDGSITEKQARILENVFFEAVINGDVWFDDAVIGGDFGGDFTCHKAEIAGELSFENATFRRLNAQEEAFRKAKQTWDKLGDRKTADDYFYKEMVAKRKQKKPEISFKEAIRSVRAYYASPLTVKNYVRGYAEYLLEAPLQYALGYGVYPLRVMFTWILVAITMGALLTSATGRMMDLPFGIAAAFVPGYGLSLSSALSGVSLWIVCIETIFGAFFWAAFIAVFSRKFMR